MHVMPLEADYFVKEREQGVQVKVKKRKSIRTGFNEIYKQELMKLGIKLEVKEC